MFIYAYFVTQKNRNHRTNLHYTYPKRNHTDTPIIINFWGCERKKAKKKKWPNETKQKT